MKLTKFKGYSKDGNIEFLNVLLPVTRIVCPKCEGSGSHVNPAIDGNGISAEEFAEDPEFAEAYMSGRYDVRCERCDGANVVDAIDEDACKTRLSWWKGLIRHRNYLDERHAAWLEGHYERLAGA